MKSLRAREFAAIAVAVVASVSVTLILAVVLVRRSAQSDALKSLARQAALIAAQQRATAGTQLTSLGVFFDTQQEKASIVTLPQAALLLPAAGAARCAAGRPGAGLGRQSAGSPYLYAAHPERKAGDRPAPLREARGVRPRPLHARVRDRRSRRRGARRADRVPARPRGRTTDRARLPGEPRARRVASVPGPCCPSRAARPRRRRARRLFNQLARPTSTAREDAERSFLLSVSHELKTPLAAIRGHGEALLDGVMTIPKAATVVVQESKRLDRLVRDLLDMARLSQHSFSVKPEPVDLARASRTRRSRRHERRRRAGSESRSSRSRTAAAPALADPDRTLQVLSNLIENALRSTPAGGSVSVTAAPGLLAVADNGPGLEHDELPHAFERFFLYSRYAEHRAVGTGLGLAIVKELTEAMNGTISVESTPGEGTCFGPAARTGGGARRRARRADRPLARSRLSPRPVEKPARRRHEVGTDR